jgi:PAT family beta-lactamase induction signal transducer AmpG
MRSDYPPGGEGGGWIAGIRVYLHPRVLAMLFLGFSAGLPFPLVFAMLTAWLMTANVSMAEIGMFAWVGVLYSLKFLWAPLVDWIKIPILNRWLGRRRSWMLVAQVGVAGSLVALSGSDPNTDLGRVAWLALATAFFSATQDIAVDAYRIEAVASRVQGAMAASYQFGYRLALLISVAGALYLADLTSWALAYQTMAVLMGVGMITVLVIAEPEKPDGATAAGAIAVQGSRRFIDWFTAAVIGPFSEFFQRNGSWALVLLLFISCYRISDLVLGIMANPFYIDIGFSLSEIATVTKVFGFFVTMLGAALGGVVVVRYGVERPLIIGAVMLAVTNLFFAAMAWVGADMRMLVVTVSADNLAAGFTGTLFIAYLSSLTNVAYTATQYALFSSLMTLPGKIISGFSGRVVESIDWFYFFIYASALGIPAVILATIVVHRGARSP